MLFVLPRMSQLLTVSLAAVLLVACVQPTQQVDKEMVVEFLVASEQCAIEKSIAYRIESAIDLSRAYGLLGGNKKPEANIDWQQERVLLLAMGRQASAGYSLTLASSRAIHNNGELAISVLWQEPEPHTMQAQLVTSPCLLVKLPREGYQHIVVNDALAPHKKHWGHVP
ncbi:MAG: protease complex subunit PrcB family protein [Gammaproteobacteria bacterium]|nr:protease complex subunit PrcB family protein [Gammaproteobacteria bacterium]